MVAVSYNPFVSHARTLNGDIERKHIIHFAPPPGFPLPSAGMTWQFAKSAYGLDLSSPAASGTRN